MTARIFVTGVDNRRNEAGELAQEFLSAAEAERLSQAKQRWVLNHAIGHYYLHPGNQRPELEEGRLGALHALRLPSGVKHT